MKVKKSVKMGVDGRITSFVVFKRKTIKGAVLFPLN